MNTHLPTIDIRDLPRRLLPGRDASTATVLTVAPFLALARELAALLAPVHPRPAFRAGLHRSLVIAARRQQAQAALAILPPSTDPALAGRLPDRMADLIAPIGVERHWAVGAAAVGGAVSLGILAYLLRHRDRPAAAA